MQVGAIPEEWKLNCHPGSIAGHCRDAMQMGVQLPATVCVVMQLSPL